MSWRRRLRSALDRGAQRAGLLQALERRRQGESTVLRRRRDLPSWRCGSYPLPSLALSPESFEAALRSVLAASPEPLAAFSDACSKEDAA